MTCSMGMRSRIAHWAREWLNQPPRDADPLQGFEWVWTSSARAETPERREVTRLCIAITTHARPDAVARVLRALDRNLRALDAVHVTSVCVIEDRSDVSYPVHALVEALTTVRMQWMRSRQHLGKSQYWRMWQASLALVEQADADYALFLQDDLEFDDDAIARALGLLRAVEGVRARNVSWPRPRVLSLFSTTDDERFGRWVLFPRRAVRGLPLHQTQWFDLPAVLMNRAALELLKYRVVPIPLERFVRKPLASSGVGRQLTRRLFARAGIYQCVPSLVFHGAEPSRMNPEMRRDRDMDNRHERANTTHSLR